ncbi:J domain-containing protein [Actinophytocola sediminis]
MHEVDYYELLGVPPGASATEIRSAYRTLAKVMHPDAGGTAGTFRLLREAYDTLSDPELRESYDNGDYDDDEPDDYEPDDYEPPSPRRASFPPMLPTIDRGTIPWWDEVLDRSARRSPKAAMVGWMLVLARRLSGSARADREFLDDLGERTVFGSPGTEPDEAGQRLTAELLDRYLTRIPAVRICHGLAGEVGSVFADIDHAVLCGRRLVLIESKVWLPGHYRTDEDDALWRNGHRFRGGTSVLADRLAGYRALLPWVEVRGVLLLYPSRPGAITVADSAAPVQPMDPERFVHEIGHWLAATPTTVDPTALATLAHQVIT